MPVLSVARTICASAAVDRRTSEVRVRWHFRHATVGEGPVIRGRPVIENRDLAIGDRFVLWSHIGTTHLGGQGAIRIGDRCFLNSGASIVADELVKVGSDVAIGNGAAIADTSNHGLEGRSPVTEPVVIGDGAWIGRGAIVLPGVTIGGRAMVAAGAVVTRNVPDDTLVAGVPAVRVRSLSYPPGCTRAWTD